MNELLIVLVLLCASLLVGNESTVGVFINPAFSRLPEISQGSCGEGIGANFH